MTIDNPLIRKLYMAPPVPVLTGLYCVCTIWLLSHSSLGRRIGRGRGREWRSKNIVWPKFAFLVGKTVPYVLGAIPTSFPGFSPTRPFKSYQYCRNCKMKANRWELRDTRGDKIRMNKRQNHKLGNHALQLSPYFPNFCLQRTANVLVGQFCILSPWKPAVYRDNFFKVNGF